MRSMPDGAIGVSLGWCFRDVFPRLGRFAGSAPGARAGLVSGYLAGVRPIRTVVAARIFALAPAVSPRRHWPQPFPRLPGRRHASPAEALPPCCHWCPSRCRLVKILRLGSGVVRPAQLAGAMGDARGARSASVTAAPPCSTSRARRSPRSASSRIRRACASGPRRTARPAWWDEHRGMSTAAWAGRPRDRHGRQEMSVPADRLPAMKIELAAIDPDVIEDIIGTDSYDAALGYVLRHAVGRQMWAGAHNALFGIVLGSHGDYYTPAIWFSPGPRLEVLRVHCGCPARHGCAHAAALLISALEGGAE